MGSKARQSTNTPRSIKNRRTRKHTRVLSMTAHGSSGSTGEHTTHRSNNPAVPRNCNNVETTKPTKASRLGAQDSRQSTGSEVQPVSQREIEIDASRLAASVSVGGGEIERRGGAVVAKAVVIRIEPHQVIAIAEEWCHPQCSGTAINSRTRLRHHLTRVHGVATCLTMAVECASRTVTARLSSQTSTLDSCAVN